MNEIDDNESVQWNKLISGDHESLAYFYQKYIDDLYSFGLRYTYDEDAVKDAIQDLFLDLYNYRKNLSKEVKVKYYLFFSLKRKILANKKKVDFSFGEHIPQIQEASSFQKSQEEEYLDRELNQALQEVFSVQLNALPSRQKEVIYLKFARDLSYEEISSIMGVCVTTCRTIMYRATKELRSKIKFPILSSNLYFILN